ncbi:S10 family peptidase [Aliidongia dinghuensis]|uniref:S10 family peptidase n=1 Tax=Aliidongia dinghuensis TaxID=1867774 RepID=UPI001E31FD28|nr:peptidase S10 [Aliidongia dinghuensis]
MGTDKKTAGDGKDGTKQDKEPPPAPRRFVTMHEGTFRGTKLGYTVTAGETHLVDGDGKPRASLFTFAYVRDGMVDPAKRPVTFLFNGGPGSASLWLHMGAFGPRRIVVPGDGTGAGVGPYEIVDNPHCPLDETDLVFIDPVGTGFSRPLGEVKPEEAWGLDADAGIIADFIKRWLTENKRWASPRYLAGESYGTTRAVAVAGKLQGGLAGVAFNGLALISVILDFHTARFEKGNTLPDVSYLPTYAATAHHYGLIAEPPEERARLLDEVRRFAIEEYAPALLAGSRLEPAKRKRVLKKLARYSGLDEAWLDRSNLRIDPARFRKELLRERGIVLGRFDTRYQGRDYDQVGELPDNDPSAYAIDSAYVSAINDYLDRTLAVEMDRPYAVFNRVALTKWDWHGPRNENQPSWPGYVNVAPELGRIQRENAGVRVLMANGLYDLATPFFAAENTIAGNGIDAARVTMRYYDAGHMMYVHEPSFDALMTDFRALVTGN